MGSISAPQVVAAVGALLLSSATSPALELAIVESGAEANLEVGLWVRNFGGPFLSDVNRLVSPSGDIFTADSILDGGVDTRLLRHFDSVAEAVHYVQGAWQATTTPRPAPWPDPPGSNVFEFTIGEVLPETINRTAPTLLAPSPGAVINNGATFTFAWDYLASGEIPQQSSIQVIAQTDPISGWSRTIVSTPRPGSSLHASGTIGSGDFEFTRTLTNVPGADKNRFLMNMKASATALPLDVEITLGSYASLMDAVTFGDTSAPEPIFNRRFKFFYSRVNEPFIITLSSVPEPSSAALALGCLVSIALIGCRGTVRHRSRQGLGHRCG